MATDKHNHNEVELSLELSIGRSCNSIKPENDSRSGETGSDLQSKREIQAFRRQEAKKKREEKLRKSWMEARQFEGRARERENRENEDVNFSRKRKNCCGNEDLGDLNLALNTGTPALPLQFKNVGIYSDILRPCWFPAGSNRSFGPYQGNLNSVHDDVTENGSAGCSSSAVSDYQSSPPQGGGSSSESGKSNISSHSTKPEQEQEQILINASKPTQQSENTTSSCSSPSLIKPNQTTVTIHKDPKQQTESAANPNANNKNANETLSVAQMPCVSTTGNGPNGKTINGLLYRYSKTEVTIVCVCHGTSFSPTGFVEHAGGIDITHPLKHITVIPSAF